MTDETNSLLPQVEIVGYSSTAQLLRSDILICSTVVHVVDTVLLVRGLKLLSGKGQCASLVGSSSSGGNWQWRTMLSNVFPARVASGALSQLRCWHLWPL